jgi:hypothetical protein
MRIYAGIFEMLLKCKAEDSQLFEKNTNTSKSKYSIWSTDLWHRVGFRKFMYDAPHHTEFFGTLFFARC